MFAGCNLHQVLFPVVYGVEVDVVDIHPWGRVHHQTMEPDRLHLTADSFGGSDVEGLGPAINLEPPGVLAAHEVVFLINEGYLV